MRTFLEIVAEDLLDKLLLQKPAGATPQSLYDFSRVAVVFPNKRAKLFFNRHLLRAVEKRTGTTQTIFAPRAYTIDELFSEHGRKPMSNKLAAVKKVYELYAGNKAYTEQDEVDGEPLDKFWGWGEVIVRDFDDIDKQLVDADLLLANVQAYQDLASSRDYLTEEQKAVMRRFFGLFADEKSLVQKSFSKLWNQLKYIYLTMRNDQNYYYYSGALYRDVVNNALQAERWTKCDQYFFVGFNMITAVETKLFAFLQREKNARFYWDFDLYYLYNDTPNEAAQSLATQMARFPNEIKADSPLYAEAYDNLSKPKEITYLSAATENVQARYVREWIKSDAAEETAIVLADESLLRSVVSYLPEGLRVNVTAGYPLQQTIITSFVKCFMLYHCYKSPAHRRELYNHPYWKYVEEAEKESVPPEMILMRLVSILDEIGRHEDINSDPFAVSAVYSMSLLVNQLRNLHLEEKMLGYQQKRIGPLMLRIMDEVISTATMSFEGEPLEGVQVMGMLETRALDFKNVLILSCNEGKLPRGVQTASFLPHFIREAYGMTTFKHRVGTQAYYFYRLLQRAENVSLAYNSSTEEGHTGQMSRFMMQMMCERKDGASIRREELVAEQAPHTISRPTIEKTPEVMAELDSLSHLSPSALGNYLRCPLQFYYKKVRHLSEPPSDDFNEPRIFGTVLHDAMQYYYEHNVPVREAVNQAFAQLQEQLAGEGEKQQRIMHLEDDGLAALKKDHIVALMNNVISIDKKLPRLRIIAHEREVAKEFTIESLNRTIRLEGRIDRLDEVDGLMRVVDYKTGANQPTGFNSVDEIFDPKGITNHSDYYLQTMLYAMIVSEQEQRAVNCSLLYVKKVSAMEDPALKIGGARSNRLPLNDIREHAEKFTELLKKLIEEILSPETPFTPCEDINRCERCAFRLLCGL